MCEAVFQAPRRKRSVYECYETPFPIPLSQDGEEFRLCQGKIVNNHVLVSVPEDIQHLYAKGFFGKGILSRSRPEYSISNPELAARWKGSMSNFPVVSSSKYQCHVEWTRSLMRKQGLRNWSIDRILEDYTKPLDLSLQSGEEDVEPNKCTSGPVPEIKDVEVEVKHLAITPLDDGDPETVPLESPSKSPDAKKVRLEGDPTYDPLAKYGADTIELVDKAALAKMYCQKHDDLLVHCGCSINESLKPVPQEPATQPVDQNEYVLVLEEESHLSNEDEDKEKEVKQVQLVCRRNPFRIFEYLQLSLEEAFFLVYALGCLIITFNEEPLPILKLWEVFNEVDPSFRPTYMAYHYFRSKGWVPKVGLKYGTDLLLYRKGPAFYHASYSVIIELVDDHYHGSPRRPFTWKSLAGLNRTTVNVSKELMFCYLIKPFDMTENDMCSPECLKRIKVQELILSRWISSKERSEQDEL
ncbi:tRNA-splicing endonuclease subunit Sen2 isoform X2 [Ambystoma mexicanum]|uniref:tRNA-splicing endonuclease subunit Sen2 isoform X2 n=1 Tax=Ambystoma mexicanum TaxID=8296 RepID=UPI0037E91302